MNSPTSNESENNLRVTKVLLPIRLIRAMDRFLVEGTGGFTTRNEFVREAIDSYILELTHPPAPPEPARGTQRTGLPAARTLLDPEQPDLFEDGPRDRRS